MNDGFPSRAPTTVGQILASLGLTGLTAGAVLFASGATTLDKLALGTAGRVMVAGASAPAWSDSGLSYASGVLTVAGSVPGTPAAGQVVIGGGVIKTGGAVSVNGAIDSLSLITGSTSVTRTETTAGVLFDHRQTSAGDALRLIYTETAVGSIPADVWQYRMGGNSARPVVWTSFDSSVAFRIDPAGTITAGGALTAASLTATGAVTSASWTASASTSLVRCAVFSSHATGQSDITFSSNSALKLILGGNSGGGFVDNRAGNLVWQQVGSTYTTFYASGGWYFGSTPSDPGGSNVTVQSQLQAANVKVTSLTAGRVAYVSTGGTLASSSGYLFGTAVTVIGSAGFAQTIGDGTGTNCFSVMNSAAGQNRKQVFQTAGSNRWAVGATANLEAGSDAGTGYAISAYTDTAVYIDDPFFILRVAGGPITLARPVTCTSTLTATGNIQSNGRVFAQSTDHTTCAFAAGGVATIGAGVTDGYEAGALLSPTYNGAFTVTRHNYLLLGNPVGTSTITDACVIRFDAAIGTHKAVDSGTTKTSPGTVTAWVKINIAGTVHYMPAYASKTT